MNNASRENKSGFTLVFIYIVAACCRLDHIRRVRVDIVCRGTSRRLNRTVGHRIWCDVYVVRRTWSLIAIESNWSHFGCWIVDWARTGRFHMALFGQHGRIRLHIARFEMCSQGQDEPHDGLQVAFDNLFVSRLVHFHGVLLHETQDLLDVVFAIELSAWIEIDVGQHLARNDLNQMDKNDTVGQVGLQILYHSHARSLFQMRVYPSYVIGYLHLRKQETIFLYFSNKN